MPGERRSTRDRIFAAFRALGEEPGENEVETNALEMVRRVLLGAYAATLGNDANEAIERIRREGPRKD